MPTVTGFSHAPVSKALVLVTSGASILHQAARASRRSLSVPAALVSQPLVFRTPTELLFGSLLLYYFRVLEREAGSSKFGAFVAASTGIAAVLQWAGSAAAASAGLRLAALPSGPYGLIFAAFVQYAVLVPPSSRVVLVGWRLSDKIFVYLMGLQLLLSGGAASLLAGGAGLVAGVLYRANVLGLKRFRLPAALRRFLSSTLGPLLGSSDDAAPTIGPGGRGQAGGGGGGARRGGGGAGGGGAGVGGAGAAAAGGGGAPAAGGGGGAAAAGLPPPSREALETLVGMGFPEADAARALQLAHNDLTAAIALLV